MKKLTITLPIIIFLLVSITNISKCQILASKCEFSDTTFSNRVNWRNRKCTGMIKFSNVIFKNEAVFCNQDTILGADFYRTVFQKNASFKGTNFNSTVYFGLTNFQYEVNFTNTGFKSVEFSNTTFEGESIFEGTGFHSEVEFTNDTFNVVKFNGTKFYSDATFIGSHFCGNASFCKTSFNSTTFFSRVSFINTKFFLITNFSDAVFKSVVSFDKTKFYHTVNFSKAEFESTVIVREVEFDSLAIFESAKINNLDFNGTILPEYLNFSKITHIENEIDLTQANLDTTYSRCNINLVGSSIDKFKFRYKRFKLWFPESDSIPYELKANVYEILLQKQKDDGFTQSYEILDKEYKEFQYIGSGSQYRKKLGYFLNWIDKNWWGYGYNKELIVINVFLIYIMFSLINALFLKYLVNNMYEVEKIKNWRNKKAKSSSIIIFIKSIPFSFFYTALIFFGVKFDIESLNYEENLQGWRLLNLVYFFIIYLGGIICLAYLANYIITI